LLDALDAQSIPWAIGTSSRRDQVAPSLKALARSKPIRIVDGTTVSHAKPHPDLLLAAAEAIGKEPKRCWCVGDSKWDMLAAVAAGMPGIGILAGSAINATALYEAGACQVLPSLAELELHLPQRG